MTIKPYDAEAEGDIVALRYVVIPGKTWHRHICRLLHHSWGERYIGGGGWPVRACRRCDAVTVELHI